MTKSPISWLAPFAILLIVGLLAPAVAVEPSKRRSPSAEELQRLLPVAADDVLPPRYRGLGARVIEVIGPESSDDLEDLPLIHVRERPLLQVVEQLGSRFGRHITLQKDPQQEIDHLFVGLLPVVGEQSGRVAARTEARACGGRNRQGQVVPREQCLCVEPGRAAVPAAASGSQAGNRC